MEILIAEWLGGKFKYHAAVRTDNRLAILPVPTETLKVPSASYSFHQRIKHHHCLGTDSVSFFVYGTAVSAGIFIADLFTVTAIPFSVIPMKETGHLNSKFILFVIPFFHKMIIAKRYWLVLSLAPTSRYIQVYLLRVVFSR